jgi:hypothetical protein
MLPQGWLNHGLFEALEERLLIGVANDRSQDAVIHGQALEHREGSLSALEYGDKRDPVAGQGGLKL